MAYGTTRYYSKLNGNFGTLLENVALTYFELPTFLFNGAKMVKGFFRVFSVLYLIYFNSVLPAQSVQLTWEPEVDPEILHYSVYRSTHADSGFVLLGTVSYPANTYMDEGITMYSQYYYAITSTDLAGNESGFSNTIEIETSTSLPVELTSYTAEFADNNVILRWTTATESNNFGFEIQRSKDGVEFSKVGFVKGYGSTTIARSYRFVDEGLPADIYHYRLKQLDTDGKFEFSKVNEISIEAPGEFQLSQNYPNPFNPSTTISYSLPESGHVELTVFNAIGQEVHKLVDEYQTNGRYTVTWKGIDVSGKQVASGIYYYKIKTMNHTMFRRMIFMK